MTDLILRPSGLSDPARAFSLQLRYHGPAETEYLTIARVSGDLADEIVRSGAPYFLFSGDAERVASENCEFPDSAARLRRAALKVERADLIAQNAKAEAWGAGIGARQERIAAIDEALKGESE